MQKDAFQEHVIWTLLAQAEQGLASYSDEQRETSEYRETLERIEYLRWILEESNPLFVSVSDLNTIENNLQTIVNHISSFPEQSMNLRQGEGNFQNIFQTIDYPRVRKIFRSEAQSAIDAVRHHSENAQLEIAESFEELRELSQHQSATQQQIHDDIANLLDELGTIRGEVTAEFQNWEDRAKSEISKRLTELNTEFQKLQDSARNQSQEASDTLETRLKTIASKEIELRDSVKESIASVNSQLTSFLDEKTKVAQDALDKIMDIYQVAGQTTLAGDFVTAAKEEANSADRLTIGAGIFFILAPVFYVGQWFYSTKFGTSYITQDPYAEILLRLASSAVFVVPAAYFATTARRHRRVAVALRSLGVRVATFDAYLVNVDEPKRTDIKDKLSTVFFSGQISPDNISKASAREVEKSIKSALEEIEKLKSQLIGK